VDVFWLLMHLILGAVVLLLAVLLVGSLRAWAVTNWRLAQVEQLEATSPNRRGLPPGIRAPAFVRRSASVNVLFLRYEDLIADLPGSLRRISAFCGLQIAPERWPGILQRCSFAFMKEHEHQFDPLTALLYERGFQPNSHLRKGQAGGWRAQLSPQQARRFHRAFGRRLGHTGIDFGAPQDSSGGPVPCCASASQCAGDR
jgi:hypothetical protein